MLYFPFWLCSLIYKNKKIYFETTQMQYAKEINFSYLLSGLENYIKPSFWTFLKGKLFNSTIAWWNELQFC